MSKCTSLGKTMIYNALIGQNMKQSKLGFKNVRKMIMLKLTKRVDINLIEFYAIYFFLEQPEQHKKEFSYLTRLQVCLQVNVAQKNSNDEKEL